MVRKLLISTNFYSSVLGCAYVDISRVVPFSHNYYAYVSAVKPLSLNSVQSEFVMVHSFRLKELTEYGQSTVDFQRNYIFKV